jgi:hypothetical protein
LIPNPIRKVLSSIRAHRVRALLMGGQACVFYGAAEFSRDTDFVILADAANLARLRRALAELQAEPIAVPPFEIKFLRRGHALHFRCQHPEALRLRVDVIHLPKLMCPALLTTKMSCFENYATREKLFLEVNGAYAIMSV